MSIVPIDRDAASKFVRQAWHLFWPNDYERAMQDAKDIEAGRCDNWLLVESFAAHRVASEQGDRMCALMDSQYRAGVTAGWNVQFADDPNARLAELKRIEPGFLAALKGTNPSPDTPS